MADNGNGLHVHVEKSAPLEKVLFVTNAESTPIVALPSDGSAPNLPPLVGLQIHADEIILDSDGSTSEHRIFEFALPVEAALLLQLAISETLVEIHASSCGDPTCPVHNHS